MTKQDIMERFDSTPTQIKINSLLNEAKQLDDLSRKLSSEACFIKNEANKLINKANEEGNKVADDLDKEYPEWRITLVNELRKTEE